ncbi:hypothetical protein ACHAXA_003087 [Cyclostephanos tholiformis]|uniref:VTT domain-containing protein n=1 Tax=Cyclostephanos tholiformis TaxID=382380 RepID=A0ABD3ST13_9STRA
MSTSSPAMDESSYQNPVEGTGDDVATTVNEGVIVDVEGRKRSFPWTKMLVGAILVGIIIYVIVDSATTGNIRAGLEYFLGWIETNVIAGVFAFTGVYFVATIAFVPGSILTLGSGFVFGGALGLGPGVALATTAVFVGASLGSVAAFLIGRYLLRDRVRGGLVEKYPIVMALDEAFKRKGFFIFLLLRLSPIVPFNAINYIGGITSIKLRDYTLALLGMLPGTILYCFIGATAGSLTTGSMSGPATIASIVIGIILGLIAVFVVSYYARKEFDKIVAQQERLKTEHQSSDSIEGPNDSTVVRPAEDLA